MSEKSSIFEPLEGLDKALDVQGGIHGLGELRTDAGLYLHLDVADFLSRRQTYMYQASTTTLDASGAANNYNVYIPSLNGLRYGRYLTGLALFSNSFANLVGGGIFIANSGIQPDYPATNAVPIALFGGATEAVQITTTAANFYMVFRNSLTRFPLWMPPGSYLNLSFGTSGASGNGYLFRALYHTTEELSSPLISATRTPVGQLRAPIKV